MTEIKSANGKLIYEAKILLFKNVKNGKTVSLSGGNEFILYLQTEQGISVLPDSAFDYQGLKKTAQGFKLAYQKGGLCVTVEYRANGDVFEKRLSIVSGQEIEIKRLCLENRTVSGSVTRGGEGQPVFVQGENVAAMWCGIEFPAANNGYDDKTLCFMQTPFEKTCSFTSLPVVYGLDACGDLFRSFADYIKNKSIKKNSLKVYCDWGLHDDMTEGDPILTAEMTLKNIQDIAEFSKKSGVKFDYYLMDAFWFEKGKPYSHFRKETFPEGYAPIVAALKDADMKYGLWFDMNCIHAHLEGMEKYDTMLQNGSLCLSCDEIAELMYQGIAKQIKECGVKMLKLDFAYFECFNPNHNHSTQLIESKEKSVKNFLEMMRKLKEIEPELIVICYNGWTTSLDWIGSIRERSGYAISPYWSQYVDYLYCGDPRPSELASDKLENSVVWYTDAMIRAFRESAMPFDAIDDHGTMLGSTATLYRLRTKMFRQGVLLDVMRGGRKIHLYGDVSELNAADCEYFGKVESVYDRMMTKGYETEFVGGDARKGEIYGYCADNGVEGYVMLVNPSSRAKDFLLSLPQWKNVSVKAAWKVVDGEWKDGASESFGEAIPVSLSANGYVLIEWSIKASVQAFETVTLLPNDKLVLDAYGKNALEVKFLKDGAPLRTYMGLPEGFAVYADGKKIEQNVQVGIWSGCSWAHYSLKDITTLVLAYEGKMEITLKYDLQEETL